jgi:hypothetical protein
MFEPVACTTSESSVSVVVRAVGATAGCATVVFRQPKVLVHSLGGP